MTTNDTADFLRTAMAHYISEKRIRGINRQDGSLALVTDADVAQELSALGLASKAMGAATRAALSPTPLELGEQRHLINWEGDKGLIAAFGDTDKAMNALHGISLVPFTREVVKEHMRALGNPSLIAQRGGRVGVAALPNPRGR